MKKKSLCECPVCSNNLMITRYECKKCGTKIEGNFTNDKFSSLSDENKDFIELFVKKRGSIKEIEKELGVSYPTVRNMLDNVISALGHKVEKNNSKIEILQMLDAGEISSKEAKTLLDQLKD